MAVTGPNCTIRAASSSLARRILRSHLSSFSLIAFDGLEEERNFFILGSECVMRFCTIGLDVDVEVDMDASGADDDDDVKHVTSGWQPDSKAQELSVLSQLMPITSANSSIPFAFKISR